MKKNQKGIATLVLMLLLMGGSSAAITAGDIYLNHNGQAYGVNVPSHDTPEQKAKYTSRLP